MSTPPPPQKGGDNSNPPPKSSKGSSSSFSVSLVLQRFRHCELLLNNSEWVCFGRRRQREGESTSLTAPRTDGDGNSDCETYDDDNISNDDNTGRHCGLLVYVSFARGATPSSAFEAAQHIVNLPLLTSGLWGDGVSKNFSVLTAGNHEDDGDDNGDNSNDAREPDVSIVLVPQANLISKVKQKGRSVQYHGQAGFREGQELFESLVREVRRIVDERERERGGGGARAGDGAAERAASATSREPGSENPIRVDKAGHRSIDVVAGTFGTRQGLRFESDMGPFCHVVNL